MKPFKSVKERGHYAVNGTVSENEILEFALKLLAKKFRRGHKLTSSRVTKSYLALKLAQIEHEVFCVVFLDNQHQVLHFEEMFRGTIDGAHVFPREVVKMALHHNAAALVLVHNHPSGIPEPSQADIGITRRLKSALELVDIRVLDHCIVGGVDVVSMAERGLV